jgi:hypothetical protein
MAIFSKLNGQTPEERYFYSAQIEQSLSQDSSTENVALSAWKYASIGKYSQALKTWDRKNPAPLSASKLDSLLFQTFKPQLASEFLIDQAEKEQFILLNEAHYHPQHRVFALSLLGGLYRQGFRYLALESLADTGINRRKYPLLSSGWYIAEPQYGELIREAIRLGFTLIGYDASNVKNEIDRAKTQALNILKIRQQDPKAKIFVLCGPTHTQKNNPSSLATQLKILTEIDPFTIDQVAHSERSEKKRNSRFLNLTESDESVVLVDKEGKLFQDEAGQSHPSCLVIHPLTRYRHGRPAWLYIADRRRAFHLPTAMLTVGYPCIAQAYHQGEHKDAVPADVVEFLSADHHVPLVLVHGEYRIELRDAQGGRQVLEIRVR